MRLTFSAGLSFGATLDSTVLPTEAHASFNIRPQLFVLAPGLNHYVGLRLAKDSAISKEAITCTFGCWYLRSFLPC